MQTAQPPSPPPNPTEPSNGKGTRASRLEFKTVDEIWDLKTSQYNIVESSKEFEDSESDQYVFVVRVQSGPGLFLLISNPNGSESLLEMFYETSMESV